MTDLLIDLQSKPSESSLSAKLNILSVYSHDSSLICNNKNEIISREVDKDLRLDLSSVDQNIDGTKALVSITSVNKNESINLDNLVNKDEQIVNEYIESFDRFTKAQYNENKPITNVNQSIFGFSRTNTKLLRLPVHISNTSTTYIDMNADIPHNYVPLKPSIRVKMNKSKHNDLHKLNNIYSISQLNQLYDAFKLQYMINKDTHVYNEFYYDTYDSSLWSAEYNPTSSDLNTISE